MNFNVNDSSRKYMALGLTVIVIIGLIASSMLAKKQDANFQKDTELYDLAVQQLQEKDFNAALATASDLEKRQGSSEEVTYIIALASANLGDLEKGLQYMERLFTINPHRVEDSLFMIQYAELLIQEERMDEAKIVLAKCEELPIPEEYPEFMERVIQLKEQL